MLAIEGVHVSSVNPPGEMAHGVQSASGATLPAGSGHPIDRELEAVRQLRSLYDTRSDPALPLGFGDYLSLLFRLHEHNHLLQEAGGTGNLPRRRDWYTACCGALCQGLGLEQTSLDTAATEKPYDLRQIVSGLRPLLRSKHGAIQAAYYEIALGGLLRQRGDILRADRSVRYAQGGPGSGITDEALRARIESIYFTRFDRDLLEFSRQLVTLDALLLDLMPVTVGEPVAIDRLRAEYGYPDRRDPQWGGVF